MGLKTPKPPAPTDFTGAARDQGAANLTAAQQTTALTNPNQVGPYGSQNVTYAPDAQGNMQPTVTQTLNPDAQKALTSQQKTQANLAGMGESLSGQLGGQYSQPFQSSAPGIQTSLGNQYSPQASPMAMAGGSPPRGQAINYGPGGGEFGLAGGGPAGDAFGLAGSIDAEKYGLSRQELDLSNVAKMPVNAGMTGQQAIMARLQPQIQQQEAATAQQLANQGITPGSEAYNNAMRTQSQQANDLYSQAALQGINLDTAANQQGFSQALSQAGLYNQGLGENFGRGFASQGMTNASIGQNFGQAQDAQRLQNAAIGQNFGQAQASAAQNNQAQGQGFNQNLQTAQFGNDASNQALARQLQLRQQPFNEINSLMGASQIQNPQFQGYTGANVGAAPTLQGAQLQGQQAQDLYGQQMGARNANAAAYGQIAGTAGTYLAGR